MAHLLVLWQSKLLLLPAGYAKEYTQQYLIIEFISKVILPV